MKLGCTLLVRDEIDMIKPWLEHHLPLVDEMVITDNNSIDGTRELLQKYKSKKLMIIDEPEKTYLQDQWVDRMIRILKDKKCTHVFNSDCDEMWHCDFKR